jgi:hypothetical protein
MSQINVDAIRNQFDNGASVDLNGIPIRKSSSNETIGIGFQALLNCTGNGNVGVGKVALQDLTTGDDNTGIGNGALQSTTGNNNVGIGRNAGYLNTTGGNNVFIGLGAEGTLPTASNEITLGNNAHTILRCAVTTITALSDARDKKDIQELPVGLDFVNTLKPVTFVWNDRDESGKHEVKDFGFIAQDLKKAQEDVDLADTLKLVYESNPEKLEASYGKLIPILIKAIQDLSKEVDALKNK